MTEKTAHEPTTNVMMAAEVWEDAKLVATVLRQNLLKIEPVVKLQIPFSIFVSALDGFDKEELVILRQRVEEKLATV